MRLELFNNKTDEIIQIGMGKALKRMLSSFLFLKLFMEVRRVIAMQNSCEYATFHSVWLRIEMWIGMRIVWFDHVLRFTPGSGDSDSDPSNAIFSNRF